MNKYVIIIFLALGISAAIFGVWAKVLHKEFAGIAITVAVIFEVILTLSVMFFFIMWFNRKKKKK